MNMKRLFAILLSALLCAAALVGCAPAEPAESPVPSETPAAGAPEEEGVYIPGTYTGEAQGYGGVVTVTVTVDETAIVEVVAEGNAETAGIGSNAIEQLPAKIVEAQSAEVEGVTGATFSSNAVKQAAEAALAEARGESAETAVMAAGTYTAEATGYGLAEPLQVTVTVTEDAITSIEVDPDNAETEPVFEAALEIIPRILETQSLSVDTIAGATLSSGAIRTAATDAVTQALVAGGSGESAISAFLTLPEESDETVTIDTDIVVVGMGASGLATLTRAAETLAAAGQEVNILGIEKNAYYGGCSLMASDFFAVNPQRHQEKYNNGENFMDADVMRRVWFEYTEGDGKQEMIDIMIDYSGEALDWLEFDHGYQFAEQAIEGFTGEDTFAGKIQFLPNDNGATNKVAMHQYFTNLVDTYTSLGGEYMLETEGYDLIYDEASNTVTGVKARSMADGTEYVINAKVVVLASGGFINNAEMTTEYLTDEYYPLSGAWYTLNTGNSDGKMIEAAIGIGAGTYNIGVPPMVHLTGVPVTLTQFEDHVVEDKIGTITNRTAVWSENDVPKYMVIYPYTLAVNKYGDRFATEESIGFLDSWKAGPTYYSLWSADQIEDLKVNGFDTAALTGPSVAWLGYRDAVPADHITTRDHLMALAMPDRYVTCMPDHTPITMIDEILQAGIDAGFIYKADTLEELAEVLGMDASSLVETVESYNAACAAGVDEAFGKQEKYLRALGEGPYYAVTGCAHSYSTTGGLDVNTSFQVLQADGATPINGLYAVGTDCSGVLYTEKKAYVTYGGAAQGWAYTSGYVCGKLIADSVAAGE